VSTIRSGWPEYRDGCQFGGEGLRPPRCPPPGSTGLNEQARSITELGAAVAPRAATQAVRRDGIERPATRRAQAEIRGGLLPQRPQLV